MTQFRRFTRVEANDRMQPFLLRLKVITSRNNLFYLVAYHNIKDKTRGILFSSRTNTSYWQICGTFTKPQTLKSNAIKQDTSFNFERSQKRRQFISLHHGQDVCYMRSLIDTIKVIGFFLSIESSTFYDWFYIFAHVICYIMRLFPYKVSSLFLSTGLPFISKCALFGTKYFTKYSSSNIILQKIFYLTPRHFVKCIPWN